VTHPYDLLYDVRRLISVYLRRVVDSWSLRDAPSITYRGIRFVHASDEDEPTLAFERLKKACDLIEYYDPYQFRQLSRLIHTITVEDDLPARAVYFVGTSICAVTEKLLTETTASVAAALVHEATHARLDGFGVRQRGHRLMRIETICMKAEIDFVKHFPPDPLLDDWIAARMKEQLGRAKDFG
jgi:hypothetical protein